MWLTLVPLLLLLLLFYFRRKSQHRLFKGLGIPGPQPNWFFGNLLEFSGDVPLLLWMRKCTEKYGSVWGFYEGPTPCLVIGDPDFVQESFVRQFSSFHSRKVHILQEDPSSKALVSMFNANGNRWKRLRTIVNPAFSEVKLRKMFPLMKKCIDASISQFEKKSAEKCGFNIFELYKQLTLEIIGECAFGITLNAQMDNGHDSIFNKVVTLFNLFGRRPFFVLLAEALPETAVFVRKSFKLLNRIVPSRGLGLYIRKRMIEVIQKRKENSELRRTDILQLMLDAEIPEDVKFSGEVDAKALSKNEIISQAMLFLFAGYETSSTALSFITHALATHPEVQERLQAEIDDVYESQDDPERLDETCDHLANMEFLNAVINETLRLFPIGAPVVARKCMSDTSLCGYHIPKGTSIIADVYSVHFDPALWGPSDPNDFDPDRFLNSKKRHSSAFLAFGIGPRFCVGQRFALTEIRALLFRMLRRFSVRPCATTENPVQLKYRPVVSPANTVDIVLEPRNI